MPLDTIKQDALESLNVWHSDKLRGHKVYFADAVEYGIDLIIKKAFDQGAKSSQNVQDANKCACCGGEIKGDCHSKNYDQPPFYCSETCYGKENKKC